jgi:hypothetical protein
MTTERTFGVELEFQLPAGMTLAGLGQAVRRSTRIECRPERYSHATPTTWKLVTDGSVGDGGGEMVSPILKGEAGIAEAVRIADAMKAAGCTVDVKCGLHVHVFVGDLSLDQLRKLAVNFVHAETAFDAIMPPSRRKDLNQYILSNRTAFGGGYENASINKAITAYSAATSIPALVTAVSSCKQPGDRNAYNNRYRKLNLVSYDRQKTVEFRQHGGTVESEKVANWIRLCVAFVERSMVSRPRPRTSTTPHVEAAELGQLLTWLRLEPLACKYFRQRRKEFSSRTADRATALAAAAARAETDRLQREYEAAAPARAIAEAEAAAQAAIDAQAAHEAALATAAIREANRRRMIERREVEQTAYFAERRAAAEAALAAARN